MRDRHRTRTGSALLALSAAAALACATGSGRGGGVVYGAKFPSQQELARIEAAPAPVTVFAADLRDASEWVVEGPAPERIDAGRWLGDSRWDAWLGERADQSGGRVVPNESMHCVAREIARFALEQGGQPDESLRRFILGSCNAPVGDVVYGSIAGSAPASVTEEELFERWRDSTASLLEQASQREERSLAGIAFARRGESVAVYLAFGWPEVEIEPVSTVLAPGQRFELRGRALAPAQSVDAAVNRGPYGVKRCEPVGDVRLPAFHLSCEPDPADRSAYVTLSVTPPERILATSALHALVFPQGRRDPAFRRFEYARPRKVSDRETFTSAFLEELNGVRERAGMRSVTLDSGQSATSTRVAPHFFAALTGETGDDTNADTIALGLLAGWNVEGTIRTGGIAFGAVPQTDDLSVLLAACLEEPMSRIGLLDPEIERVAVGPIVTEIGGVPALAAVVNGYDLFDGGTHDGDADRLFARLAHEREVRELAPPYRLVDTWMKARNAATEVQLGERPDHALDELLEQSLGRAGRRVNGWWGETSDLDEFVFPEEYLTADRLGTAIGVSHRKEPGQAWGRYIVMIVAAGH